MESLSFSFIGDINDCCYAALEVLFYVKRAFKLLMVLRMSLLLVKNEYRGLNLL